VVKGWDETLYSRDHALMTMYTYMYISAGVSYCVPTFYRFAIKLANARKIQTQTFQHKKPYSLKTTLLGEAMAPLVRP